MPPHPDRVRKNYCYEYDEPSPHNGGKLCSLCDLSVTDHPYFEAGDWYVNGKRVDERLYRMCTGYILRSDGTVYRAKWNEIKLATPNISMFCSRYGYHVFDEKGICISCGKSKLSLISGEADA